LYSGETIPLAAYTRSWVENNPMNWKSLRAPSGITLDRNVPVQMRDGVQLMVNVFQPTTSTPVPVLMSVTPFSKTYPDTDMPDLAFGSCFLAASCTRGPDRAPAPAAPQAL
jgi:predicted acyl esterase